MSRFLLKLAVPLIPLALLTPPAAAQDAAAPAGAESAATPAEAETPQGVAAPPPDATADTPAEAPSEAPAAVSPSALASGGPTGIGRPALPEEIAAWDLKVMPDGRGLPAGSGDVATGEDLFIEHCAVCHGDFAEGLDNWPSLAGGEGTLDRDDPEKTVGSYWPYLSTVWDYVNRSMPFGQAQILTPDETYAITAYILYSNQLVEDDFVLSGANFAEVKMPNAGGFIEDDRPETEYGRFSQQPCMENCKDKVEITRHASNLDVTPGDSGGEGATLD